VAAASNAERERFPEPQLSVSLAGLRSEATWENGAWHSGSRWFADTEEVTGSDPVAPTIFALSRAFVDLLASLLDGIGVEVEVQRPESSSLLKPRCSLPRRSKHASSPRPHLPPAQTSTQGPAPPPGGRMGAGTDVVRALAVYSSTG
jgi:hypothetical protein